MIATAPPPPAATVIVQAGETLSEIAQDHGVSLQAVEASNPQISNPASIYVGESVTIPGQQRSFQVTLTCTETVDASGNASLNDCSTTPRSQAETKPPAQQPQTPNSQPQTPAPAATPIQGGSGDSPGWVPVPGMPDSFSKCVEMRESSDNPLSVNAIPGYIGNGGGLFGDLKSTWNGYDGYAQPFQAPVSVQVQFNSNLFKQYGTSPWDADSCNLDGSVR